MAELNVTGKSGRMTPPPRIDLTPMVDLGFLLITFFMFTTTLADRRSLEIRMPAKVPETTAPTVFPASRSVTIIPGKGHVVKYYEGLPEKAAQVKSCPVSWVTNLVTTEKARVARSTRSGGSDDDLYVLIKPSDDCSYSDVVAILDAMLINDVQHYSLAELTTKEKQMTGW